VKFAFEKMNPFYITRSTSESTGAISWDGSFDWPKRSDAINKTRPNDAPTSMPPPKPRGEGVVVFVKFAVKKITFLRAFAA